MIISLFKNAFSDEPQGGFGFEELIDKLRSGYWSKQVTALRNEENPTKYKRLKAKLPAVTISGQFESRDKQVAVDDRLIAHTGLICIDIDRKDNIKMRTADVVDNQCLAQFVSCSGEGIKIVYRCSQVATAKAHRRIYDAIHARLEKKGVKLKLDPVSKSIAALQYVSYDAKLFYNPKTKLVVKPLAETKTKTAPPSEDKVTDLQQLNDYIDTLGDRDVTKDYENWMLIMFGLSYSLGEEGREPLHRICSNYPAYSKEECDEFYDACLERIANGVGKPVTIATVYQILIDAMPKVRLKHLAKKYNKSHAVGVGEEAPSEEGDSDLAGMVRYKLILFRKIYDKETNTLTELIPDTINLNVFEALLKEMGFYRFEKMFVWIQGNIVEEVDLDDILRIVTQRIEEDGDYHFIYKKIEFMFSWEEIVHLWRTIRARATTYNQIASSLTHWVPNLLKDNATESYVPYLNGVVKVTAKQIKLLSYAELNQQIWKERILPRDFTLIKKKGMFEEFFENVCGRGDTSKQRRSSENFKRSLWYFGYMLQGSKRQSTARAWLLYDIRSGNSGRSGKTIIGQAVGKIRSMVTIDGKQVDLRNRFAFQTVQPWTDVVFIDDPSKYMSLVPLFNMISGEINADRKNQNPVVKGVKFMLASNWILEAEGNSEIGRQFVTQLDDFYVQYSAKHNDTIMPLVHLHGKEFFTDWDEKEWGQFDSFAMSCLQFHLSSEPPTNTIIGNASLVRFVQLHEEELFFELCAAFHEHVREVKEGGSRTKGLIVPRDALTNSILENIEGMKLNKAGRIAREFLLSIGAKKVEISSMAVGSFRKMAYKIEEPLKQLQFGNFKKRGN